MHEVMQHMEGPHGTVRTCIYAYACMYVCVKSLRTWRVLMILRTCMCIHVCLCVYVCMYVCVCVHEVMQHMEGPYDTVRACMYIHVCVCMYVRVGSHEGHGRSS